ncbi:putative Sulfatase N-terminal domain-containing protein [Seiridium unicorne]|uniref:Sulfatase N-terminal domain-containing protein n=1 Tax=Seiridium unicorne TaxID=138068 RepID=A0ABR2V7Y9_9PEZI
MADDHASKAISCYGPGINNMPNLDRIANDDMIFHHCYVTNSICTPSRATVLTGMHNHVNEVLTLDSKTNNRLPNVAKALRVGGYQIAMIGNGHLGEGEDHEPNGFDYWSVSMERVPGYATDVIMDKSLDWIKLRIRTSHSSSCVITRRLTIAGNATANARAAKVARIRVAEDLTYFDLGLAQPDGGSRVGNMMDKPSVQDRKIPTIHDGKPLKRIYEEHNTAFTFSNNGELAEFKFQRYMQRYLRTAQSIDDNVCRILDFLNGEGLAENTIVIYTSDQGFFLGEHGCFDKRFMYEESFQMPFLIRYPKEIKSGSVCNELISNVDFAPTFFEFATQQRPTFMQGYSFRSLLQGRTPSDW